MLLFFLFACSSEVTFQGTLVGNPGRGDALLAEGKDITFHSASGRVDTAYYVPQSTSFAGPAGEISDTIDLDLDLLQSGDNIPLIKGQWEAIGLQFSNGLTITGETNDGQSISLQTAEIFVELINDAGISISDNQYIIEVGYPGWLSAGSFGESTDLIVEADSTIADILNYQSGLFLDLDKDGSLSEQERSDQSLSDSEPIEEWEDEEEDSMEGDSNDPEDDVEDNDFPNLDDDEIWEEWEEE